MPLEDFNIGSFLPWSDNEKPEGFSGDTFQDVINKINANFNTIATGGVGEGGGSGGDGTIGIPIYNDPSPNGSTLFQNEDNGLAGWQIVNGNLTYSASPSGMTAAATAPDCYIWRDLAAAPVDGNRFVRVVVSVKRLSGEFNDQRFFWKTASHDFEIEHSIRPLFARSVMPLGEEVYFVFDLTDVFDWRTNSITGYKFQLDADDDTHSYFVNYVITVGFNALAGYENVLESYINSEVAKAEAAAALIRKTDAETAAATAFIYQTGAESAQAASEAAQAIVEEAVGLAETAKTQAESAMNDAQTAQDSAEASALAADASKIAAEIAESNTAGLKDAAELAKVAAELAEANSIELKDAVELAKIATELAEANTVELKDAAELAKIAAEAAEDNAVIAQIAADAAKDIADAAKTAAQTAATNADGSATAAAGSASAASTSATSASNSATSASGSATLASTKAGEASTSAASASTSATQASTSASNASGSAAAAQTSATNAATSATSAGNSATAASNSASSASTSATNAGNFATAAQGYSVSAETQANDAATSAGAASSSATSAANSASTAAGSASSATTQASNAATSAASAGNSATAANTSASTAATHATNAGDSASAASTSATNAATSATAAGNSATAANTSASNAATSATAAGTSASQASTSATNSANSATAAGNSATAANTSASNAATSATAAGNSASTATTQATNAANSATAAGNSATAANTSASTAQTAATNAGTSASQASTSATNAANSATAAGNSATAANTSASTAATHATSAGNSASAAATSATTAANSATAAGNSATAAATSASTAQTAATAAGDSASSASMSSDVSSTSVALTQKNTLISSYTDAEPTATTTFAGSLTGWSASTSTIELRTIELKNYLVSRDNLNTSSWKTAYSKQNLLLRSQEFNTTWSRSRTTVLTNVAVAPDGTTTAEKLEETSENGPHHTNQTISYTAGVPYTFSVFLKASERTRAKLQFGNNGSAWLTASNSVGAVFDLSNGTVVSPSAQTVSTSMTHYGDGWYRCSITGIPATSANDVVFIFIVDTGTNTSYTGTVASGIFMWGAQVEPYAELSEYTPTTSAAVIIEEDYNRRNISLRSQDFGNASWSKINGTIETDSTFAPDGISLAQKLVESATSAEHYIRQTVSLATKQTFTYSIYAKAGSRSIVSIRINRTGGGFVTAYFDLSDSLLVANNTTNGTNNGTGVPHSVISTKKTQLENGWYRCSITFFTGEPVTNIYAYTATSYSSSTTAGSGNIYLWGTQLEPFEHLTDYIPTTSAAVTVPTPSVNVTKQTVSTPSGPMNVDLLVPITRGTGTKSIYQSHTFSGTRKLVVIAKSYNGYNLCIGGGTFLTNNFVVFNLQNGTVSDNPATLVATITSIGNGWFECSVESAGSATLEGTYTYTLTPINGTLYPGSTHTGNGGVYIYQNQLLADTAVSTGAVWTPTGSNPTLNRTSLNFPGSRYTHIIAKVKRIEGTTSQNLEQTIYYSTSGHGSSTSFYATPVGGIVPLPVGEEVDIIWDMRNLTASGNDWITNNIIAVRMDLVSANPGKFEIISFSIVGPDSAAAAKSAQEAATSATAANTSASNAATSATAAGTSAANASTSASSAATSATNAGNSATAANTSASTAATHATSAGNSASAASTSATNAANSATAAGNSATAANTSASNAATSATAAGNSASSASTSASTAATSATNAGNSATAAATSATAASTSASNSSTSAATSEGSSLRAQHYTSGILNPGFEGAVIDDTTAPLGWLLNNTASWPAGSASLAPPAGTLKYASATDNTNSPFASKICYGANATTQNGNSVGHWSLSKRFKVTPAMTFNVQCDVRVNETVTIPSSITATASQSWMSGADMYAIMKAYNAAGTLISTVYTRTLAHKLYEAGTTGAITNTWRRFSHAFTIPALTDIVEIVFFAVDGGAAVRALGYFGTGASAIFMDDFRFFSTTTFYEIDNSTYAAVENSRSAAFYADQSQTFSVASQNSATTAQTAATNAGNSASAAATSASAAAASETAAQTSAAASQTARVAAEAARDNAQTSSTAAATSATNAAASATAANTSAGVSQTQALKSESYSILSRYTDAEPTATTSFAGSLNNWTGINATLSLDATNTKAIWTPTTTDPRLQRTSLSFLGSRYTHIIVRVKRLEGTENQSQDQWCFYSTSGHSFTTSFYARPVGGPQPLPVGVEIDLVYDMRSLTAGGNDWITNTITGIRLDLLSGTPGSLEVLYIGVVGPDTGAPAKSAQAAATSASSAATSASAASTSASAANTSATNASTSAGAASTSQTAASTSATNAAGSASAAGTSATNASNSAASALSSSINAESYSVLSRYTDAEPTVTTPFNGSLNGWLVNGGTLTLSGTNNSAIYSATSSLTYNGIFKTGLSISGNRYTRLIMRVKRIVGPPSGDLDFEMYWQTASRATWSGSYYTRPIGHPVTLPVDVEVDLVYNLANPLAGGTEWVTNTITGVRLDTVNTTGSQIEIMYILLVGPDSGAPAKAASAAAISASQAATSATAAGNSATSASGSANTATTQAGNASASASAASTSAANASTSATNAANSATSATSSANTATTQAGNAATSASSASTSAANASTSAANASQSSVVSARISQGAGVLGNPHFSLWSGTYPDYYNVWNSGSGITKETTDVIYGTGTNALKMTLDAVTQVGIETDTLVTNAWPGPTNEEYYVLEVDFKYISGTLSGACILLDWNTTVPATHREQVNLTTVGTPVANKRYSIRKVIKRPVGYTGTYASMRVYIMGNWNGAGALAAKTIIWDRVQIRTASTEEIRTFNVATEISAAVATETSARVAADGSIEAKYAVKIDANGYVTGFGLISTSNNATPTSSFVVLAENFLVARPGTGGTPKQVFEIGTVNGVSTLVMRGNLIADGTILARSIAAKTITTDKMTISMSSNLIPNADFKTGNFDNWSRVVGAVSVVDRLAAGVPAGATSPFVARFTVHSTEVSLCTHAKTIIVGGSSPIDEGVPVIPGEVYRIKIDAVKTADYVGGNIRVEMFWVRASTGAFSNTGVAVIAPTTTWATYDVGVWTVPAEAIVAQIRVIREGAATTAGSIYWTNLSMTRAMTGELIVDGSITANKVSVTSLSALSANLGTVTTGLIQSPTSGVRIDLNNNEARFDAAKFSIYNGSSPTPPFLVEGGIVYINNARIKQGDISQTGSFSGASATSATVTLTLTAGSTALVMLNFLANGQAFNTGAGPGTMTYKINTVTQQTFTMPHTSYVKRIYADDSWYEETYNRLEEFVRLYTYTAPSTASYTFEFTYSSGLAGNGFLLAVLEMKK